MELDRKTYRRVTTLDSNAFRLEYQHDVLTQALRKDIHTYLAEYRFRVPVSHYELLYKDGHVSDIHGFEPMKEKARRAIALREMQWKNSSREQAEYFGIESLDSQMKSAELGDTIIWASPPGTKEDGYGNYGFFFVGKIDGIQGAVKHITMSALRVEYPTIPQVNKTLVQITGRGFNFQNDVDCLANPIIVRNLIREPEEILVSNFELPPISNEQKYKQAMHVLEPAIEAFIARVKNGDKKVNLKLHFNAIENLADKLAAGELKLLDAMHYSKMAYFAPEKLIDQFGYKPRLVAGSCGDTGGTSSNVLERPSFIQKLLGEKDEGMFICPNCHKKSPPPVKDSCPKCHYTKEEHIRKGNSTC